VRTALSGLGNMKRSNLYSWESNLYCCNRAYPYSKGNMNRIQQSTVPCPTPQLPLLHVPQSHMCYSAKGISYLGTRQEVVRLNEVELVCGGIWGKKWRGKLITVIWMRVIVACCLSRRVVFGVATFMSYFEMEF